MCFHKLIDLLKGNLTIRYRMACWEVCNGMINVVFVQLDKFLLVNSIAILCQGIYCFCPTGISADEQHGNSGCNIESGDISFLSN